MQEILSVAKRLQEPNIDENTYLDLDGLLSKMNQNEAAELFAYMQNNKNDYPHLLGLLFARHGKMNEAIQVLNSFFSNYSSNWVAYVSLAQTLFATKQSIQISIAEKLLNTCSALFSNLQLPKQLLHLFKEKSAFHGDPHYKRIVFEIINSQPITSFVETGTYLGHSLHTIASKYPDLNCYSCEINSDFYQLSRLRCNELQNVEIQNLHTVEFLKYLIDTKDLGDYPVFFIDAHWEQDWPLLTELNLIKNNYPNALVIIDDMQVPGHPQFPYDNYGGEKVCSLEQINREFGEVCSQCIIPTYTRNDILPHTSLSGYGIFSINDHLNLNEWLDGQNLTSYFSTIQTTLEIPKKIDDHSDKKIIGLLAVKNEENIIELSLRTLALYVDSIIVYDDCSTDRTVEIAESIMKQCKVEKIIRNQAWDYNETNYRQSLLDAGRLAGGTHFVCLDADEAFTSNLSENGLLKSHILDLKPGEKIAMYWLQLWRSTLTYRWDNSVWTNNTKVFVFADDGKSNYHQQEFHLLRYPLSLEGQTKMIQNNQTGVMHFQFVNWENLLIKQAWYRCLERIKDPTKDIQEINQRYAPSKDEAGLKVLEVPNEWFKNYDFFSPQYFAKLDGWRLEQVKNWFQEKGREFFKDLDIWDIDWDHHFSNPAVELTEYNPATIMDRKLSPAEIHILKLIEPKQGWFSQSEIIALFRTVQTLPEHAEILEIGSFMGRSTNAMAHASIQTQRELYALDVWLDFGEELDGREQTENGIGILNQFVKNTAWFNDRLRTMKGSTNQYRNILSNYTFDMIFIDAAHDYNNVVNDINVALTCIKPGCFLLGHDYHNQGGEEVIQAVHDTLFKYEDVTVKGVFKGTTVWYAQIPETLLNKL